MAYRPSDKSRSSVSHSSQSKARGRGKRCFRVLGATEQISNQTVRPAISNSYNMSATCTHLSPLRVTGFLIAPRGRKICLFDQLLTFRSPYTEFLLRCSPTPSSSRTLATKRVSVVTPGSRIFCSTSLMVVSRTTRSPH
jgi:hypothetical protein